MKILITETFGENRTYINQFFLLKDNPEEISYKQYSKDIGSSMDLSNMNPSDTNLKHVSSRIFDKEELRPKPKSDINTQIFGEFEQQRRVHNKQGFFT